MPHFGFLGVAIETQSCGVGADEVLGPLLKLVYQLQLENFFAEEMQERQELTSIDVPQ